VTREISNTQESSYKSSGVTLRAQIIGLVLAGVNCYWLIMGLFWEQSHPTVVSLFFNAIFSVFVLALLNLLLKRFLPRHTLGQGELLTIYVMLSIASAMGAQDMVQVLIPTIPHPFWFATPENEWADLFFRYIPSWLAISDKDVVTGYFNGESTLYTYQHIKGWLTPVMAWSGFVFALVFVMLCMTVVVRKRWTEEEKLSYPIIQLPLEMTNTHVFFRSRLMWIGFGIAGFINLINGLHYLFPAVPGVGGTPYDISSFFTMKPWDAIGWTPMAVYPFVVGLGFFIPLDLSFSCWFFYFFWKGQKVLASALGLQNLPGLPYIEEQSFGAYIGLCLFALWMSRRHLARVMGKVFGVRSRDLDDSGEPLGYRAAVLGIIIGMVFITAFCYKAGMSLWVILFFFAIYFAMSTAISRIRAELGSPIHDLPFTDPGRVVTSIFGTRRLGTANLTMLAFLFFFNRGYRGHPMPHQLEAFKMAERTGMDNKRLLTAMVIATVVGVYVSSWAFLHASYKLSATANWRPSHAFNRLQGWLSYPSPPDYPAVGAMISGLAFTIFLWAMRMRFLWWRLHPAGYAVSGTWAMNHFWLSIFASWLAKAIILRHGGLKAHRRAIPFFLGVILGDFVIGGLWSIIGIGLHKSMYRFLF
jgi:hypothetical protein